MKQNSKLSFSGQAIYVGIDTGKKSWKVTIRTEHFEHRTFSQDPKPEILVNYLHRNFPEGEYHCVYEAGYFGFWIYEYLKSQGLDCIVVHASDVPTSDKERRNRNDHVDSRKLARSLQNGELIPLYVPSREAQEDRNLVRMRTSMVRKQTRCKNQIKSLLSFYGIEPPMDLAKSRWSNKYIIWLEGLEFRCDSGRQSLNVLVSELRHIRQSISDLTQHIRQLSRQESYREQVSYLKSIPGIGLITSMVFLTEIVDINRFRNLDHLASYVGLIPGEDSSGDKEVHTGISRRRNQNLRYLLIESSWTAVRKDPALAMSYNNLVKRMPKNRSIIRIARKLLSRIRYVLKNRESYEPCVVS
jgi:transposase